MSKSSKEGQASDAVLTYLNTQNRPYSANDVFNNLHKEYGKTAVERALDTLADSGNIQRKLNGKQKAYVADQSQFPAVDDTKLKSMESTINKLTEELKSRQTDNDKFSAELRTLNASLTTQLAMTKVEEITEKVERAKVRLQELKTMGKKVSPEERQQVMKAREIFVKEWRKRKRMSNDILDAILEGYPKKKRDLYEDIGIETDEDYKLVPPEL